MSVDACSVAHMFDDVWEISTDAEESVLIEAITTLERLKAAAAARQARLTAALASTRCAAEAAAGVPTARQGQGIGTEIALARNDSPHRGNRHLGLAKALVHEMPHTLAALEKGALSEWRATLLVRESACLEKHHRATLDAELCSDPNTLDGLGDNRLVAAAKTIAYRLDPHSLIDRARRAENERTVTIRPAPDAMTYLTALLPMAQGVSVYATLKRTADTTCDGRSRGQIMADTLIERITGAPATQPVPIAVNVVLSDQTLLGASTNPAIVTDYGPIPASLAHHLITAATTNPTSAATLRRLYATPTTGALVALESQSRCFPKGLADFINLRDQYCRTPYCDAPIRHHDHATPHHRGGPTTATNALGLCEACNYTKETPGWNVSTTTKNHIHTAIYTTPTNTHYHSTAPPIPTAPAA